MRNTLSSATERNYRLGAVGVLAALALSFASLAAAPLLMPESYSWISHTTSESAAQGVEGAWLARLGFLALGLAVIWLSALLGFVWSRGAVWLHASFGVFMVATAAFSLRAWMPEAPFDPTEDWLHSFTATAMGFSFAFGVLFRLLQRTKQENVGRLYDVIAIVASVVIPLTMVFVADGAGLVQRFMFLIAYVWYGKEAFGAIGLARNAPGTGELAGALSSGRSP